MFSSTKDACARTLCTHQAVITCHTASTTDDLRRANPRYLFPQPIHQLDRHRRLAIGRGLDRKFGCAARGGAVCLANVVVLQPSEESDQLRAADGREGRIARKRVAVF